MDYFQWLRRVFVFSSMCCLVFVFLLGMSTPVYSVVLSDIQNSLNQINPSIKTRGNDKNNDQKKPKFVPGELIVKFKKNATLAQRANVHANAKAKVLKKIPFFQLELVTSQANESTPALLKKYKNNPMVEYAEPNGILQIQLTPNDPRYPDQWSLNNAGDNDIDAVEAWDMETGSESVIVADVDTGIDYLHEDLAANIWVNTGEIAGNGIDDDGNGYIDDIHGWDFINNDNDPMDDHGHGTHTSGIIAAAGNNNIGIAGISWRSKLIALKAFDQYGNGSFFYAASAIIYAADKGAKVSNNSYGCLGEGCVSLALEDAFNYAEQRNMLNVVAAGNDSNDNDTKTAYPCNSGSASVICVAASDNADNLASFSNYGQSNVDVAAPGYNILSTVPVTGNACCSDPSGYRYLQGTSMATPMVAGSAALLVSHDSALSLTNLKAMLLGSVDVMPSLSEKTLYGGRLNVFRALTTNFLVNSNISAAVLIAGQSTSASVSVEYLNGYDAGITLAFSAGDSNLVVTPDANSVNPTANSVNVNIDTLPGIRAGIHRIFITGTTEDAAADSRIGVIEVTVQSDVAMTTLSNDVVGQTGKPISVSATIENLGLAQAGSFHVQYYLSTDSTITQTDYRIGNEWVAGLANGANLQLQSTLWIPRWNATEYGYPAIAAGDYYLGAIIDGFNVVPDSNPTNNVLTGQLITINTGVDDAPQWVANQAVTFPSVYFAYGDKMTTDDQGNVYRLGSTFNGNDTDVFVVKYDADGNQIWLTNYDSGFDDTLNEVTTDSTGNVYVVGNTNNSGKLDGLTIKFDANGNKIWEALNDGALNDNRNHIIAGSNSNVYTTGGNGGTIAYSADGVELWTGFNTGREMLEDSAGNIIVLSHSVEKFTPDGVRLWINSLPFFANTMALDSTDNIVVTGKSYTGSTNDVVTTKIDSSGNLLWEHTLDNGDDDESRGIATDSIGNTYVLAVTNNGNDTDYLVIKYDASGVFQWQTHYDNGGSDYPAYAGITMDAEDNIYVSGHSCNYPDTGACWGNTVGNYGGSDLLSIKYDPTGSVIWVGRWDEVVLDEVRGNVKVDQQGNLFVAGVDPVDDAVITIKYLTPGVALPNEPPTADAGGDQDVFEGNAVKLVGTSSDSDGVIVSHLWEQLSGPTVTIINANNAKASLIAPAVDVDTVLSFQYTVTDDDGDSASDVVNVTVHDVSVLPPNNLVASSRKSKQNYYHDLSWDAVNGVVGYRVYTSSNSNGPWALVADVTGTTYSRSVAKGEFAYYVVTSYDNLVESAYSLWAASDGSTQQ